MRVGDHSYQSVQLAPWNITEEKLRISFSLPVGKFVQLQKTLNLNRLSYLGNFIIILLLSIYLLV